MRKLFSSWLLLISIALVGCAGQPTGPEPAPASPPPAEQPPPEVPRPVTKPEPEPEPEPSYLVDLVVVGDIMLARVPGEAVAQGADPFEDVAHIFDAADMVVGNLECVIATVGEEMAKLYTFRCHPRNIDILKRYFTALSVANNHSGDFGKGAFSEQLDLFRAADLPYFGGGYNLAEAHTPLVVQQNGLKLAFLGYNEIELYSYRAGEETPGLAWSHDELVMADIARAKALADLVIVYPHWGYEYHFQPSDRQKSLARKMIDAGADLVVGAHPHVIQTLEYYNGKLIVYSLGNFVFDDFLDVSEALDEPSRHSHILRVTLGKDGLVNWDTKLARTDDMGIPRLVDAPSPCGEAGDSEIRECR